VAAEGVHLPQAVLCGNETLREDEVVERGGSDVGNAVSIALDRNGSGQPGEGDCAVELREGVAHGLAEPVAGPNGADDDDEENKGGEEDDDAEEDAAASGVEGGLFGSEGIVGNYVGVGEMWQTHGLMASVNGAMDCVSSSGIIATGQEGILQGRCMPGQEKQKLRVVRRCSTRYGWGWRLVDGFG
jgi:hypothetical protein